MFTGLVQALGTIDRVDAHHIHIAWNPKARGVAALEDMALGDSIAVDGICLTVTQIRASGFTAAVSPETLRRTTLGQLMPRSTVNLEASLRVGSKLGGHFVTGHIDGVGYLEAAVQTANAWEMTIRVPGAIARYVVQKGSVAVNGISLTVARCSPTGDEFTVAVIPLTYGETNLQFLEPRSPVNIEADVLGKYVEKFLFPHSRSDASIGSDAPGPVIPDGAQVASKDITPAFLAEHGYG